jgi:hypothetical protein
MKYENIYILSCKCHTKKPHAFGVQDTDTTELKTKKCFHCGQKYKVESNIKQRTIDNDFKKYTEVTISGS